jgi:gliding motility-associated-like protein
MIKRVLFLFFLFLLLLCKPSFAQNTVIHDIPWKSDTVGMWGSGSTAWSINQIDTLVDFSIGPYGDTYSFVYNLPWPIGDSVGIILDYGAYVDMQMIFEMSGWSGGSVYANYPTKIKMDFPAESSFSNGDWATVTSDYREHDSTVHQADSDKWVLHSEFPTAGKIWLYVNFEAQANVDLIYSDFLDPFNITWDTMHVIPPVNIDLDTFDIFLIDVPHAEYVIPWVAYHTDPFTGNTIVDSLYFLHDSLGWPLQFPAIFYDLIGITGSISIPSITNYTQWIENEQRLYAHGSDQYLNLNLDLVKFIQVMCHYLSNIPSLNGLESVSQMMNYEEGDTSIFLFTDPLSGEDFSANFQWDLIDAELWFSTTMHQTLAFCDNKEYTFFGIPIPPEHYPNVWDVFEFPTAIDYEVLDTTGTVIESGTSDSIRFGADYDVRLHYPCWNSDSLPVTISHTIDPWLTNIVKDSVDVDFYIKVLEFSYSIGTPSDPVLEGNFLLYQDTLNLGQIGGLQWFGPPLFMPWLIHGYFPDTTFVPDKYLVPVNNPLDDTLLVTNIVCFGSTTGEIQVIPIGGVTPYSYQWSNGATTSTISNLGAGVYVVSVTDANGCMVLDSAKLQNSNPSILINHTTTDVLCNGSNTGQAAVFVSGGSPSYSYVWSPNVGHTPIVTGLYAGTYYLTVTDNVGCSVYDTIIINQPLDGLQITVNTVTNATCFGSGNGAIDISVSGGTNPYSYNWSNGSTLQDISTLVAGNYYLTVSDINQCKAHDTITVTQPGLLTVYTHNYQICYGQSVVIGVDSTNGGSPTYNYVWNTGVNGTSISVAPLVGTNYQVQAVDVKGCVSSFVQIFVDVTQPVIMTVSTVKDSICIGDSTKIIANIIGGGPPPHIIYLSNGDFGVPPLTVHPQQTTTYVATVWDTCHFMSYTGSVTITVMPLPDVNFGASPTEGCEPLSVQFTDLSPGSNSAFSWDFGDGTSNVPTQNPFYTFSNNGSFDVTLTVTSDFGCKNSSSQPSLIEVYPKPYAQFTESPSTVSIMDPLVFFDNLSLNAAHSNWYFGDGTTSTDNDPSHYYSFVHDFTAMLVVQSNHGCLDTAYDDVTVKEIYTLYIPNTFTPDENGVNEIFIPVGNDIDPENYHFMIFDRWGEMMFETKDVKQGWDGTVNGNPITSDAVFSWVLIYRDKTGISQKKIGTATLLHNTEY